MSRLASTLLLAAAAAAQSVVFPSSVATAPPIGGTFYSFNVIYSTSATTPHDSRSQMIYATSDVSLPAAMWNSMAIRRPVGIGNLNSACTASATLVLSVSPTAHASASTTFATNHGPNQTTVLSGTLNLPTRSNPGAWPAPWEPILFTTPFVFIRAAGQSLVVDLHQTGNTGTTSWTVEGQFIDTGARGENGGYQANCKFSTGQANGGLGHTNPFVGGTWRLSYSGGMPANLMGVGAIGMLGAGQMWGGLLLPISLAPLGAPGCSWSVSADFSVPITSSTTSYSWPGIPIPNDPTLVQAAFYDHAIFVDPPANAFGAATTWSSKWTIGSNTGAPAALVSATGANAASPTGSITRQAGISIQLNP